MADSDSEFDMVSHFGAVDELIQLIYQGSNKFVLISAVDNVHWTLHLGLTGVGRWWKGQWTEKDIFKFLVRSSLKGCRSEYITCIIGHCQCFEQTRRDVC